MTDIGEPIATPSSPTDDDSGEDKEEKESKTVRFRFSLFFDGTGNNQYNINLYHDKIRLAVNQNRSKNLLDKEKYPLKDMETISKEVARGLPKSATKSDHSNVARLERQIRQQKDSNYDFTFPIYIEGIGTKAPSKTKAKSDSTRGSAFGTGGTGIKGKVEKSLEEIAKKISKECSSDKETNIYIDLDSLGFSRGAAAARHFIDRSLNDNKKGIKTLLEEKGFNQVKEIKILFCGLFDTVSAEGFDHTDDVKSLKLNSVSNAKYVIHLAAAEEYRSKFELTNISCCSDSSSLEIFLPGAHSDVGGGYLDNTNEEGKELLSAWISNAVAAEFWLNNDYNWFLRRGWYSESQLDKDHSKLTGKISLTVKNKVIPKDYSYLACKLMAELSCEIGNEAKMYFNTEKVNGYCEYYSPNKAVIKQCEKRVRTHIDEVKARTGESNPEKWHDTSKSSKDLRGNYLHFSAHYNWVDENDEERFTKPISPFKPEWEGGGDIGVERTRRIFS